MLAIVGPSGAGKSSLLRLLNRLDEPTAGTVFLGNADYRQIPTSELRRRVGMVMQRPYLFPGTVEENLQFGPKERGARLSTAGVDGLLNAVGLSGYNRRDTAQLSGGESQRVSLARTLANNPEVLLLDEPTSALDEEARLGVEVLIQQIVREEGLTCVLVTHDLGQAARLTKRALVMAEGRIVRKGPIEEVLHA
jgi:putative ABC transport system ATP-binding protein